MEWNDIDYILYNNREYNNIDYILYNIINIIPYQIAWSVS